MKKNYSIFFLLVFLSFLVGDTLSHHHHHDIEDKGIVAHENFQDCNLCLFSNVKKPRDYSYICQEKLKTATYMCRNIPYQCFYLCSDVLNLEKKISFSYLVF